jgi:hypothetical protein
MPNKVATSHANSAKAALPAGLGHFFRVFDSATVEPSLTNLVSITSTHRLHFVTHPVNQ